MKKIRKFRNRKFEYNGNVYIVGSPSINYRGRPCNDSCMLGDNCKKTRDECPLRPHEVFLQNYIKK